MPHKRNPVTCEQITGLARVVRSCAVAGLEDIALWGERDISHSSVERVVVPDATSALEYMARKLAAVIEGLRVYPDQMRANMERTGGLVFSHRVLLALLDKGLARDEAYKIVQTAAMQAWDAGGNFRDLIRASGALTDAELAACFDPAPALRHIDEIFARAGLEPRSAGAGPAGPASETAPGFAGPPARPAEGSARRGA
jgi:adenylosuccinate lyase